MSVTYGIDIKSTDDPFLSAILDANQAFFAILVPGRFLVDAIPICMCPRHSIIPAGY